MTADKKSSCEDFNNAAAGITRHVDKNGNVIYRNGQGLFHREDGPAITDAAGVMSWWLNGHPWPEGRQVVAERKKIAEERAEEEQRRRVHGQIEDLCRHGLPYDITIEKPFVLKPRDPA